MNYRPIILALLAALYMLLGQNVLASEPASDAFRVSNPLPEYREIGWRDLIPKGWIPPPPELVVHGLDEMNQVTGVPVVDALNNTKLRLPGYVLPIKFEGKKVKEFLLVPFVGACIHVPPPPENQIVYVTLDQPIIVDEVFDPVWVNGVMTTEKQNADIATAGYHMKQAYTEVYSLR